MFIVLTKRSLSVTALEEDRQNDGLIKFEQSSTHHFSLSKEEQLTGADGNSSWSQTCAKILFKIIYTFKSSNSRHVNVSVITTEVWVKPFFDVG